MLFPVSYAGIQELEEKHGEEDHNAATALLQRVICDRNDVTVAHRRHRSTDEVK